MLHFTLSIEVRCCSMRIPLYFEWCIFWVSRILKRMISSEISWLNYTQPLDAVKPQRCVITYRREGFEGDGATSEIMSTNHSHDSPTTMWNIRQRLIRHLINFAFPAVERKKKVRTKDTIANLSHFSDSWNENSRNIQASERERSKAGATVQGDSSAEEDGVL